MYHGKAQKSTYQHLQCNPVGCSGTPRPLLQPPAMPCLPRALHPTPDFVTPASAIARIKMEMYFLHWKTMKYQGQRGKLYLRACCVRRAWHLIGFGKRSLQKMVRMSFAAAEVPKAMDHKACGRGLPS